MKKLDFVFLNMEKGDEKIFFTVWTDGTVYKGLKERIENFSEVYHRLKKEGWTEV